METNTFSVNFTGLTSSDISPKLRNLFSKRFPSKSTEQIEGIIQTNIRFAQNKSKKDAEKIAAYINGNGGIATVEPMVRQEQVKKTLLSKVTQKVTDSAGIERIENFSIKDLFSETFKKRSEVEIESHCMVGTTMTTPPLTEVNEGWPKPWLFIRLFAFMLVVYLILLSSYSYWGNANLIPGIIFIGSFAMPITVLIFFFEMNAPNNVSLVMVSKSVLLGGAISLLSSLILYDFTEIFGWLGNSVAGLVEEPGKLIALLLITNYARYYYIHNGILFGAAVGAGFAAFESMGYAFGIFIMAGGEAFLANITLRGLLSPFAHIVWTAMLGGALWRVREGKIFHLNMLIDARFLKIFFIAVSLHMIWNMPFELPFFTKYLVLGFISWVVIVGLLQEGLKQISLLKKENQL